MSSSLLPARRPRSGLGSGSRSWSSASSSSSSSSSSLGTYSSSDSSSDSGYPKHNQIEYQGRKWEWLTSCNMTAVVISSGLYLSVIWSSTSSSRLIPWNICECDLELYRIDHGMHVLTDTSAGFSSYLEVFNACIDASDASIDMSPSFCIVFRSRRMGQVDSARWYRWWWRKDKRVFRPNSFDIALYTPYVARALD